MKKVIKFSSPFCAPCKQLTSNLAKVQHEYFVEDVNILDNMTLAQQYGIRGVPVLVKLDESGQEVSRLNGLQTVDSLSVFLGGVTITEVVDVPGSTLLG